MTNEQRKKLVAACEEELTGDRRASTVQIHLKDNVTVVVDYCIKYGTGTGAIMSVSVNGDWLQFPRVELIDSYFFVWGREYHNRLSSYCNDVEQALDEIKGDKSSKVT